MTHPRLHIVGSDVHDDSTRFIVIALVGNSPSFTQSRFDLHSKIIVLSIDFKNSLLTVATLAAPLILEHPL